MRQQVKWTAFDGMWMCFPPLVVQARTSLNQCHPRCFVKYNRFASIADEAIATWPGKTRKSLTSPRRLEKRREAEAGTDFPRQNRSLPQDAVVVQQTRFWVTNRKGIQASPQSVAKVRHSTLHQRP